jgi:ArsR family transcriptional regulator
VLTSTTLEPAARERHAAAVFAALADPARLRILRVLAGGQRCVCDINGAVPMAANVLSYHLRVLREAGLIDGNRRGRWIDYHLSDGAAELVGDAVRTAGCEVRPEVTQ